MIILAFVIATLIPLLCFVIIYRLDFFKTGDFRFTITSFIAGGLAYAGAYFLNTAILNAGIMNRDTIVRFGAPAIEEILKAIVIIILVQLPRFTYFVDGAIYGFAAGMGFAVVENYQYILGDVDKAIGLAIARVLSTNLVHASASALAGTVLGLIRYRKLGGKIFLSIGGLVLAFTVHSTFNNLVQIQSSLRLVFAIAVGFAVAAGIIFIIKRGLRDEQAMIRNALGETDRVTANEAAAVQDLSKGQKLQRLKDELKKVFGEKNATKVENFLLIQARLGILRESLNKIPDPKMRESILQQIATLRDEMEKARKSVGPYVMMHLRNTFVESDESINGRLRMILQERASNPQKTGNTDVTDLIAQRLDAEPETNSQNPASPSLWNTLQNRTTKNTPPPKN